MKYMGGKHRHGAAIAQVVKSKCKHGQSIIEPFCGALWVTQHFQLSKIYASDICSPLITLYREILNGWDAPDYISEEEYTYLHEQAKEGIENALIGFAGFACSWGGKWFGGYARGGNRNYVLESKTALINKLSRCRHVDFSTKNYRSLEPRNCVIYCDPPYSGTTGYSYDWCSHTFWMIMNKWSENNTVIVSEYSAPTNWKVIWEEEHFSMQSLNTRITLERLFTKETQ